MVPRTQSAPSAMVLMGPWSLSLTAPYCKLIIQIQSESVRVYTSNKFFSAFKTLLSGFPKFLPFQNDLTIN